MRDYPEETYGRKRTRYAIDCREHNLVYLTEKEYDFQMNMSNHLWRCPICFEVANWDDDNYQEMLCNPSD